MRIDWTLTDTLPAPDEFARIQETNLTKYTYAEVCEAIAALRTAMREYAAVCAPIDALLADWVTPLYTLVSAAPATVATLHDIAYSGNWDEPIQNAIGKVASGNREAFPIVKWQAATRKYNARIKVVKAAVEAEQARTETALGLPVESAPVEVKPAPEAPTTAIVYRELDTIGAEVYLKSKSAQRAREMYYSHPAADSAEFEVKPATTSPALVETGERVSEATSAYWNHYRQMETKRGNGRYAKNTAVLVRDTETLYNLSKQLGQAATTYAQMVSLSTGGVE